MFDILNEVSPSNGEDLHKSVISTGNQLYESRYKESYPKLGNLFESADPKDNYIGGLTSIIMRNQEMFLEGMKRRLGESTIVSKLGDMAPRVLDVVRINKLSECLG
jgi:hypothetical protein